MNIICSVCYGTADLKLLPSKNYPGVRYIACHYCREANLEPRALVVLGYRYGDRAHAKRSIKYKLYAGPKIEADEVVSE